jgi:hypothetical protein
MQVGLVTRSAVGAARPHQNFMPLCRGALVRCRGCAASTLLAWVDDTAAPTKAWCRVWCKTKCNKLSKPSHPNRSQPSSLLHGMQGVSGSNPLGSIERTQAWPGFFNALVHPRQGGFLFVQAGRRAVIRPGSATSSTQLRPAEAHEQGLDWPIHAAQDLTAQQS